LQSELQGAPSQRLTFFIEVKTFNVVDAAWRLQDMREDALDAQVELERQANTGRKVAIAMHPIQPYHRFVKNRGSDPEYDPYSVRDVICMLIDKAVSAFKVSQFERGPTFALASLLRLPLPGQGRNALAPYFYDPRHGGACVSGVLWQAVFGTAGAPIHRSPEFEGAGTVDGFLDKAGLLVDPARQLPTPGVIFFGHCRAGYCCRGLYDASWASLHGWSNLETEAVLNLLCDDVNDRENTQVYKYAR
jgi:hypothetical protein